jgi:hypothetical protein
MSQQSHDDSGDDHAPSAQDIALGILLESENLPRLMELHYYASEPGFAEILRTLIGLPGQEREQLQEFLSVANGYRIRIRRDGARLVVECVPR